jgi:hypothetical protein
VNEHGKGDRQADPERAHEHRLFEGDDVLPAVQHYQIEDQQQKNSRVESDPESDGHGLVCPVAPAAQAWVVPFAIKNEKAAISNWPLAMAFVCGELDRIS